MRALAADRGSQTIEGEGPSAAEHWETSGIFSCLARELPWGFTRILEI